MESNNPQAGSVNPPIYYREEASSENDKYYNIDFANILYKVIQNFVGFIPILSSFYPKSFGISATRLCTC